MSALPVTEAAGLPYASEVAGVMHACGHDVHVSTPLGAAKLLTGGRDAWSGTYIALSQPVEDVGAESRAMVDDGLVTKVPRPDVAFAQHGMPMAAGTVRGECITAESPQEPDFDYYDQFPLTSNDAAATDHVTKAFIACFGAEVVHHAEPQTASENFSRIPDAFGVPYTFWLIGGVDPETYRAAVVNGTVSQDIPGNHSPFFAPVMDPTPSMGVQTHVVAALSYLAKEAKPADAG